MKLAIVLNVWGNIQQKYFVFIFAAFLVLAIQPFSTHAQDHTLFTEEEKIWLADNPVLKATNDAAWAPLDYVRAGKPAGFSVDYLKLVAEKAGFTVDFVNGYTWAELMELARNREIDIVHAIIQDGAKREFLHFTDPYLDLPIAIYGQTEKSRIDNIADLIGKTIGVIDGSGVAEQMRNNYPNLNYQTYNQSVDALADLSAGEIDVFIGLIPTANYAMKANYIDGIQIIGRPSVLNLEQVTGIHLAAHKDEFILNNILEKGMTLVSEEEILALEKKWQFIENTNSEIRLTAEEAAWVKDNPVIRATNEMNWAPIDFVSGGEAAGFSVDYLNLLTRKIGIDVEYVSGHSWEELIDLIEEGEIDVAQSITETKDRLEFLNFTRPYLDLPKVYVARTGAEPIRNETEFAGRRVGLIQGWSSSEQFKKRFPALDYVYYPQVKDALYGLAGGEIDVFSERLPVVNYIISKNFITGLEVTGTELFPELDGQSYLRVATRKELPILHKILEKAMAAVTDEEFSQISEKWRAEFYSQNDIGLSIEEIQWLASHNVVKVLIDTNLAPYEFIGENGNVSGISGAYLEKIANKLNIQIEWAGNQTWDEGYKMFVQGDAHVVSGITPTPERQSSFIFTAPYIQSSSAIFTKKGGRLFVNMEGLSGQKIAQERGFALTSSIRRDYPDIEIVEVNNITEALQMVVDGTVDAHVGDIPSVAYQIATENLPIIVAGQTTYTKDTSYGVHPNLPLLASAMQKAMASITKEEINEINNKWLAIKFENNLNHDLIIKIVSGAIICLIFILIWALSLRREIHRRRVIERKLVMAQRQAEAANDAKSTFLANMSHEIRTPLNAIIGFSEIMSLDLFGKISPPRYKEYLEDIETSGRHLATVINDILDLSKIEAGKWELTEATFDLDACMQSALKMVETQAVSKQVRLFYSPITNDGVADIIGDEVAFRRIIINLLSNAVKFTDNGGLVCCSISKADNNDAIIKIRDTGVGIAADKIEHVLTPFGQSADNQHMVASGTGTGLGLSIVKDLVELHGGTFVLKSEVEVGTEAIISVPACKVIEMRGLIETSNQPELKSISA